MDKLIRGKPVAERIYKGVVDKINTLKEQNITPCIAVVIIGNRKDSITYVNMKSNKCTELGILSHIHRLDEDCSEQDVIDKIHILNNNKDVNGILVQLPLPEHINE